MTIGDFRELLKQFPHNYVITFGSSSFTRRPLVYNRIKPYGNGVVFFELTEISCNPRLEHDAYGIPEPEHEQRITVARLLEDMRNIPDKTIIEFGGTTDCAPLKFKNMEAAVAINFIQEGPPLMVEGR